MEEKRYTIEEFVKMFNENEFNDLWKDYELDDEEHYPVIIKRTYAKLGGNN